MPTPAHIRHRVARAGRGSTRAVAAAIVALAVITMAAAPAGSVETVRNGDITFARVTPGIQDFTLWTAHSDGSHQRPLTQTQANFNDWAPGGRSIAYDFFDAEGEQIATVRPDGTHLRQLTHGPGISEVPRFSPDGQHLAFDASAAVPDDPSFHTSIWVMRTDGSDAHALTRDTFDVEPVYSPDGRHIAFGRITGVGADGVQNEALYVMRIDGTGAHQVLAPTGGLEHPDWSPDGSWLVFNIDRNTPQSPGSGSVIAVHPDGTGQHVVRAGTPRWAMFKPIWSPDGKRLLVGCYDVAAGVDNLCTMKPDGRHLRVIVTGTRTQPVNYPNWGPRPS